VIYAFSNELSKEQSSIGIGGTELGLNKCAVYKLRTSRPLQEC
jgi:hypothetical protein